MTPPADVLVVGAGPTGLALALQAHDHGGARPRRRAAPRGLPAVPGDDRPPADAGDASPLGVSDELLALADASPRACLHLGRPR